MGFRRSQTGLSCATALALGILTVITVHAQLGTVAWVQRYSTVLSADAGWKIVTDSEGNVVVVGDSNAGVTGYDWLVLKYSNAGVPLWTNRYNGPANGDDYPNAVAVDDCGNVFVTGISSGNVSDYQAYDYTTIAYASMGIPLWTNLYNGPGSGQDEATGVAVDGSGHVFVTGYSRTTNSSQYATLAYSREGVPLWTNTFNGPANGPDEANAIAVDGNGQVFVTGYSGATNSGRDFATIAYSNDGVARWTNRYSSPGQYEDRPLAMAVDNGGHVFVTGYSTDSNGIYHVTIAYSNTGVPLWTNRYNGNDHAFGWAVAVDSQGNVFVTGASYSIYPYRYYLTIAYSGTGVPLWTNRYNGAEDREDVAYALAVDSSGNVFVTGYIYRCPSTCNYDYATVAYSNSGVPLWTNLYNGPANWSDRASGVAVDGCGNVFVTGWSYGGVSGSDCATLKYSPAGVPLWTNRYNGPAKGDSSATAVAVDNNGNVIVTGSAIDSRGLYQYVTLKYSATGSPLWTNRYTGPVNGYGRPNAVAVDRSGNVFVTGKVSKDVNGNYSDYATVAYSSAGVPLWTNRYTGLANAQDAANAVAVDVSGNVFVTGSSALGGEYSDFATIAYSNSGVPLWTNRYNGNIHDNAYAVAVDSGGNVFVTGSSYAVGAYDDYATVAYSAAGVPLWTNRYDGPLHGNDDPHALAVDGNGDVIVTGVSGGSGSGDDYALIKYSGAGVPLWTNRYNGPGNYSADTASAVAVDGSANVYVTGYSSGVGGNYDYVTIAYSGAGMPLWTNRYDGPANGDDYALSVVVDHSGNVVVTGISAGSGSGTDFATIAYSSDGLPLWTNRYNGPANGDETTAFDEFYGFDWAFANHCLAVAPDGVVVVGGSDGDFSANTNMDYAVVKYLTPIPLRITAAEKLGNDLRLSIASQADYHYNVQARADLATGGWINVVTSIPSDGALTQTTVTNALLAPQQFYRIQQSP